jgi:hypothetical protein
MKIGGQKAVFVRAGATMLALASAAHADVVFERATNWVPGISQGTTINNPSTVGGQAAWQYEVTQGDSIGSVNPWYEQAGQLMTWDPAWYSTGWGVWSKGDNLNPPVLPGRLIHNVHPSTWGDVPLVRWMNPFGNTAASIAGTLTLNWNGVNGLGRPVNVDVVIAKQNTITNSTTVLYSTTVAKPNPFPSVGDSVFLPISLTGISLAAGDTIIVSHRGQSSVGPLGAWVNLYDSLGVTVVPAPGSAMLLGLGGVLAVRRRRRRR